MKLGSLFAGIGGFDLAFERNGFEVAWQVEWDSRCQAVLRKHWPTATLHGDISTVKTDDLEHVDVITFGSPCQDLSVANTKREGLGGERSGLFHAAVDIIAALQPEFAVWENVPGAFSSNNGRDFAAVLAALVDAGATDLAWRTLDAQRFGVPQRRRRIFLVADFRGQRAGDVLALSASVQRHSEPHAESGEDAATTAEGDTGTADRATFVIPFAQNQREEIRDLGDCAGSCQAGKGTHQSTFVAIGIIDDHTPKFAGEMMTTLRSNPNGGTHMGVVTYRKSTRPHSDDSPETWVEDDVTNTLNGFDIGDVRSTQIAIEGIDFRHATLTGEITSTLQSKKSDGYSLNYMPGVLIDGIARRLTPREWERLQGFPDDWTLVENPDPRPANRRTRDASLHQQPKMASDSTRYKQLGNSVAVPVVEQIAAAIARELGT